MQFTFGIPYEGGTQAAIRHPIQRLRRDLKQHYLVAFPSSHYFVRLSPTFLVEKKGINL